MESLTLGSGWLYPHGVALDVSVVPIFPVNWQLSLRALSDSDFYIEQWEYFPDETVLSCCVKS